MSQPTGPAVDRADPKYLARAYADLLTDIKEDYVGRDEAIDVIALATLSREHVLLIGPPGTAKTALLRRFAALLDEKPFTYLLTRFTEPTELFGPVDVALFQQGEFRVKTDNMLPRARLAFLDEVFEGSSAILNSLLTLINERTFYNGSRPEPSELITLLGSSNQIPDDPMLAAFSDRFLLRSDLTYVDDNDLGQVLDHGWAAEKQLIRDACAPERRPVSLATDAGSATFPVGDLNILQDAVSRVDLSPIRSVYVEILRELRMQQVAFSDRRAVKAQKVFAAAAVLDGRREAQRSDLAPLAYLWTDRRDHETIRRALETHEIELDRRGRRVRELGEIMQFALPELVNRRSRARTAQDLWEISQQLQALKRELASDYPLAKAELKAVEDERGTTVRMIQEKSREEDRDV